MLAHLLHGGSIPPISTKIRKRSDYIFVGCRAPATPQILSVVYTYL